MSTTESRISVVLATFNGGQFPEEQVESIASQYLPVSEIVLTDDLSSDDSVAIVKKIVKRTGIRLVVLYNEQRLGYSRNFERGLLVASGDFIFTCDQDDVWLPNKTYRVLQEFNNRPEISCIVHDLEYTRSDLSKTGLTKIARMEQYTDALEDYVTGAALAVRRRLLIACLPLPSVKSIDYDTWLSKCSSLLGEKFLLREVLTLYRRHDNNVTAGSVLNDPNNIDKSAFVSANLRSDPTANIVTQIELDEALLAWANSIIDESLIEKDIRYKCVALTRRLNACVRRVHARRVSWPLKPIVVSCNYIRGDYAYFSGLKSMVKDFIT